MLARLDRLASVATLGVGLAAPRTALVEAQLLGPRIQPLCPANATLSNARRQEAAR